jgi:hypothetical protein
MVPVSITHVIFEPLDFIARLAALVPKPRANLTRFHGVFAPNSKHRALVTPSKRGKSVRREITGDERSPVEQHAAMSWAQRLKRVFNIDISICEACGGAVKVIAGIEDPAVIKQILAHLEKKTESKEFNLLPGAECPVCAECRSSVGNIERLLWRDFLVTERIILKLRILSQPSARNSSKKTPRFHDPVSQMCPKRTPSVTFNKYAPLITANVGKCLILIMR